MRRKFSNDMTHKLETEQLDLESKCTYECFGGLENNGPPNSKGGRSGAMHNPVKYVMANMYTNLGKDSRKAFRYVQAVAYGVPQMTFDVLYDKFRRDVVLMKNERTMPYRTWLLDCSKRLLTETLESLPRNMDMDGPVARATFLSRVTAEFDRLKACGELSEEIVASNVWARLYDSITNRMSSFVWSEVMEFTKNIVPTLSRELYETRLIESEENVRTICDYIIDLDWSLKLHMLTEIPWRDSDQNNKKAFAKYDNSLGGRRLGDPVADFMALADYTVPPVTPPPAQAANGTTAQVGVFNHVGRGGGVVRLVAHQQNIPLDEDVLSDDENVIRISFN